MFKLSRNFRQSIDPERIASLSRRSKMPRLASPTTAYCLKYAPIAAPPPAGALILVGDPSALGGDLPGRGSGQVLHHLPTDRRV